MREKTRKQKIFDNLFNMAYEPVIVDKKSGLGAEQNAKKPFTTIFSALNNAEQHIIIKINPGIYNQRLEIKKKDLKIQASEISQNTILINQEYPNILINLPEKNDKVYFESLKMAHTCQNNQKHDIANPSYQTLKQQDFMNFKVNTNINTCLYIKRGIVQLDECKISLAAYHGRNNPLPCIVVENQGCLILNRSQIRGSGGTIGIFSNGGKVVIKQSTIRDHGVVGVLYSCINLDYPTLTIKNCTFIKCNESITLNGPFESIIESNSIKQSEQVGISILNGNRSKITNNQIKQCKTGLYIKNSYPSILKNMINNNLSWGCVIKSISGVMCKPLLKFNVLSENSAGGIIIEGSINNAEVFSNQIKFNNQYGIKVCNRASPHIFMNKINKILGNGVHISRGCSVFLEKNEIEASLKCNLLIEGPDNINNFIFRNVITKGRGQGILTIFGEKFIIKDNQIKQNYNGIVSLTGVQSLQDNRIVQNERNGILLLCDNNVSIIGNQLQQNKKTGIFIRNTSIGRIEQNTFHRNKTQIIIQNDDNCFNNIQTNNIFSGDYDIRIPKNYRCQLI